MKRKAPTRKAPAKHKAPTDPRASVKGETIRLPGLAGWHAQTAMELARLADRILIFNSDKSPTGTRYGEIDESVGALERLAEKYWQYAGEEVSMFRPPGRDE